MNLVQIDAKTLLGMFANGYRNLCRMETQVNDLNVFPVPDGDTGTNMIKTLGGGVGLTVEDSEDAGTFMKRFSKAVLLSARGNSGVILSQFIRGFANGTQGKATLELSDMASVLEQGVESAYSAVNNPVEGTMLTILRSASNAAADSDKFHSPEECFSRILSEMKNTLQKTPEMLSVLKEAGVVDSGGMGMVYIFEGMTAYLNGDIIEQDSERQDIVNLASVTAFGPDSVLEYGYCTEFVLQLMNAKTNITTFSIRNVITFLESLGDSIVAVQDDDIVKVHVHTFTPEKVLAFARNYGEFISVKIENMSIQHNETTETKTKSAEKVKYAVVTVASGEGLKNYFAEIGATRIIDGGQTQNPSTQDFLDAFSSLNAEHIVVLPNNSNILLTAKQAADMYHDTDVRVLPTKSMAEGYSALSMMNTWAADIDTFVSDMNMGIESVTTGTVTQAVHDAHLNGVEIKTDMYMSITDGTIVCACEDKISAAMEILRRLPEISDKEVITVFYGENVDTEEAETLISSIESEFPYIECGIIDGGQKVYDFYMAIE